MDDKKPSALVGSFWMGTLALVCFILAWPSTREVFKTLTTEYPFLMGTVKIGLLGSMGDLLAVRMAEGQWRIAGLRIVERALVWAFLGLVFVVVFPIFGAGTAFLFNATPPFFPKPENAVAASLAVALATSTFMNVLFAPVMMVFHRVTDMAIARGGLFRSWSPVQMLRDLEWGSMCRIALPSILWFWIPAHTVTFMLPPVYRIITAALLAIALGFILGFAARKKK